MKQFALVVLCLALLFSLTGCIWIPVPEKPLNLYGDSPVKSVSLYVVEEDTVLNVQDGVLNLDEKWEPIAYLPAGQMQDFCENVKELGFRNDIFIVLAAMDPSYFGHFGNLIRIDYENGNFEVICSVRTYWYDGKQHSSGASYNTEKWDAFLADYFPDYIS